MPLTPTIVNDSNEQEISLGILYNEMKSIMEDNKGDFPLLIVHRGEETTIVMCSHSDEKVIKGLASVEGGTAVVEE